MSSSLPLSDAADLVSLSDRDYLDVPSPAVDLLRLQLVPEMTALLPTQHIGGVFTLKMGQITPVSHMPAWVIGAYNWRGVILWMIDLGHLCGLPPWYQQGGHLPVHPAVVLQVPDREGLGRAKSQLLGLVVHQVEDVESFDLERVEWLNPVAMPASIQSFLQGYWGESPDDKIPILDGAAILAAMPRS
jgi:positive phototaxis protein PixI